MSKTPEPQTPEPPKWEMSPIESVRLLVSEQRAATLREVAVEAKRRAAFSSVDGQDILFGLADWCARQVNKP